MVRLMLSLKPMNNIPISNNYKSKLIGLCNQLMRFNYEKTIKTIRMEPPKGQLLLSPLLCRKSDISSNRIIFRDTVTWYVLSESYNIILELVQALHGKNHINVDNAKFEVISMELKEINNNEEENHINYYNSLCTINY